MTGVLNIKCGSVTLADGTNSIGRVESIALDGRRVIDVARPLRATDVAIFGRGNREKNITFRIRTAYGSPALALANSFAEDDSLPDLADLVISLDDGTHAAVITLPGAGWSALKVPDPNGLSVAVEYSVIGGAAQVVVDGDLLTTPYPLPLLIEDLLDPFIIPAGKLGIVPDGRLMVCRSLQCDGELDLGGELAVIGEN